MRKYAYLNGKLVPEDKATISIFDRGLNYGDGLFETMKAENGKALFANEHLVRLKRGLKATRFPARSLSPLFKDIKDGALEKLLKKNGIDKGPSYLKIIVTRGIGWTGHALPAELSPTSIIVSRPLDDKVLDALRTKGVGAVLISGYLPGLPGIKSLNYLPNVLGKAEALQKGAYEGIFVHGREGVTEGTSSNVFIIKKGVLKTPPLYPSISTGILPGVIRDAVIKAAKKSGIKVREERVSLKALQGCDEAFLTNSISGVVPLVKIDGKRIGGGRPGFLTRLLQETMKLNG